MSDDVLVRVDGVSKKFCKSLKRSLIYGAKDVWTELTGGRFNPILTGRENIYNKGVVLGFSKKQIDAKYEFILGLA